MGMPFRSVFFAFPNQPDELRLTIVAAVELAHKRDDLRVQSWPQLPIFGAAIPDTVKSAIEKTDVLVCDITKENLNVYYEVAYCIGFAKSIAPVINVSLRTRPQTSRRTVCSTSSATARTRMRGDLLNFLKRCRQRYCCIFMAGRSTPTSRSIS
jgi:hypothetical protein